MYGEREMYKLYSDWDNALSVNYSYVNKVERFEDTGEDLRLSLADLLQCEKRKKNSTISLKYSNIQQSFRIFKAVHRA